MISHVSLPSPGWRDGIDHSIAKGFIRLKKEQSANAEIKSIQQNVERQSESDEDSGKEW
jgi:hypothetical protein